MYATVWHQLVQPAGSPGWTTAAYLGAMALGSFVLPQRFPVTRHPLRLYALLEMGIGAAGILMLFVIPSIGGAPAAGVSMLIGAVLPVLSRSLDGGRAGLLFAANLGGAALGALLAGFYFLPM